MQEKAKLAREVEDLNNTVFSKSFKAPSAWAEREVHPSRHCCLSHVSNAMDIAEVWPWHDFCPSTSSELQHCKHAGKCACNVARCGLVSTQDLLENVLL